MAEGEFTPCCWRYTTLKDLVEDMLEEEREANPWTCKDGNIIMSMIIMSKKGADLCIRTLINTPPPTNCWRRVGHNVVTQIHCPPGAAI